MLLQQTENKAAFAELEQYALHIQSKISASAAATTIIVRDQIVHESYNGTHEYTASARVVDTYSQFNVGSVRKTYLGFAISLAIYEGKISSLDDPIGNYLSEYNNQLKGITLRHLLTHTHGLQSLEVRVASAGTQWAYNNVGVNLLIRLVEQMFGKPLAHVIEERVFSVCGFTESGWRKEKHDRLVWLGEQYADNLGNEANLFVSARELALWGYLHLKKGKIMGKQIVPEQVIELATSIATPNALDEAYPRNGFFWFVQDIPRPKSELGDHLPKGSYQSLGITGCACLVIPKYETVAVRMYNQHSPSPEDYNYLSDIKTFGNMVLLAVKLYNRSASMDG